MRFRFEMKKKPADQLRNRQIHYRRMLGLFLMVVLLCSGCGSIILSGNLEFSANGPIQTIPYETREEQIKELSFGSVSNEKYSLMGTVDAFLTLPGHICTADIPGLNEKVQEYNDSVSAGAAKSLYRGDFKVIDYNAETESFIYAYYTPYKTIKTPKADPDYPELGNCGLDQDVPKSGNASDPKYKPTHAVSANELAGYVLVLMSYKPETKDYKVFLSTTYTFDENAKSDNRCIAGMAGLDAGIVEDSVEEAGGMIDDSKNFRSDEKNYYVYAHNRLYLFKQDGTKLFSTDYTSIVEGKAREMATAYGNYAEMRYTVENVELDGRGVPYFTLNMEVSNKKFDEADAAADDIINNDKDIDDSEDQGEADAAEDVAGIVYFHGTFACLRAGIGGSDGLSFTSSLSPKGLEELKKADYTYKTEVINFSDIRKSITVVDDVSTNKTHEEEETFDQALKRMHEKYGEEDEPIVSPDMAYGFKTNPQVQNILNTEFSVFSAGNYFLGGQANGRTFDLYDYNNVVQNHFHFGKENYQYEDYYFLWFSETKYVCFNRRVLQNEMQGNLVGVLNARNYKITDLRPGRYGGKDWAYYTINNYREENGQYAFNSTDTLIDGHAQPLVCSKVLKWDHLDREYFQFSYSDKRMVASTKDDYLHWGDDPASKITSVGDGCEYYYNNTFTTGFNLRDNINGSVTSISGNTSIDINTMLRFSLPFVLVYTEREGADNKTQREYLPLSNDDNYKYILPVMTLQSKEMIPLTKKWILHDDVGDTGDRTITTATEYVAIPGSYKMEFPEGTFIQIMGDTWIGNRVKAGDEELNALAYYSVRGDKLATEKIYQWTDRSKYPIYDNASGALISSGTNYGDWMQLYYRKGDLYDFFVNEKDSIFATVQQERQGKNGLIYDRLVPGEVSDLGIWKVNGQNIVACFTDQVIRFYKKEGGSTYGAYRAKAEIRLDELQSLTTGYMMRDGDDTLHATSSTGNNNMDKISQDMGQQALTSDEGMYQLNSANILPINDNLREFLYFSGDGGIHELYLADSSDKSRPWQKQGRIMNLLEGSYYSVFPDKNGLYKVVGYQTQEYSYTGADVCLAKVYTLDMTGKISDRNHMAVQDYLEHIRNIYLIRTHTLKQYVNEEGKTVVEIVQPSEDDTEYVRGKTLLTGKPEEQNTELKKICAEYGISYVPDEVTEYMNVLKKNYDDQRKAISEMYQFLGIDPTNIADNAFYLQFEGRLFNASYASLLEQTMVEIVLSDNYLKETITPRYSEIDGMVGVHKYDASIDGSSGVSFADEAHQYVDEYAVYRKQYRDWLLQSGNDVQKMSQLLEDERYLEQRNQELSGQNVQETMYNIIDQQDIRSMSGMDFYKAVSDDLEQRYLKRLEQKAQ